MDVCEIVWVILPVSGCGCVWGGCTSSVNESGSVFLWMCVQECV